MNAGDSDSAGLRDAICEVGRRLYLRGLCSGFDGNLSVRMRSGDVMCTPSGVCKGFLNPDGLWIVDPGGRQVSGEGKPTSELAMHLAIYRVRPDIRAVVHFHPPCATAFAVTGRSLPEGVLAEAEYLLGQVVLVPYGRPGGDGLAEAVARTISGQTRGMLLANHGAVTIADDPFHAWSLAESLETWARIAWMAESLGSLQHLPEGEAAFLRRAGLNARGSNGT